MTGAALRWRERASAPTARCPPGLCTPGGITMAGTTFAQLLVTQLRDLGIERVHVRNEEAGAFAAGAEARLTGKLAVCAGSCGPGNTHLIQGLFDAHRDGAPVLAIASHIPSEKIGTGFFQETHPEILFREC